MSTFIKTNWLIICFSTFNDLLNFICWKGGKTKKTW